MNHRRAADDGPTPAGQESNRCSRAGWDEDHQRLVQNEKLTGRYSGPDKGVDFGSRMMFLCVVAFAVGLYTIDHALE